MAQTVGEIMTTDVVTVQFEATVLEAAQLMRDEDIGDVVVMQDDKTVGILTDRDIVVRVVAEGKDFNTTVSEIASHSLTTVSSETDIDDAIDLMGDEAIRLLPVVDNGRLVGILSLGDLAIDEDETSALSEISTAPPNN
ncbi:MAG: CBS domain-containing protein [SAR202 cluster bacterium]|nr:CBS domain-containing protein [SAR202 cluster bacterium]